MAQQNDRRFFRKFLKFISRILRYVFGILLIFILIILAPSLWRRWITYPALEKELTHLHTRYQKTRLPFALKDYKGVLHNHSYWSHDSRGILKEILPAAQKAGLDFIFFSDHPRSHLDSFPRAYDGQYENVLMISGSESHKMLIWPLDTLTIDWNQPINKIIREVIQGGGLVFYAHTEEPHDWLNPNYQGMEIYNIHTDLKDENFISLLPNIVINKNKFHGWIYRGIFDEPTQILARWDSLNTWRRIVGIAANDAHNNQNIRARYLRDGRVEWVGPNADPIDTTKIGFKEKLLLGTPDSAGWAFRWDIDPYYESFRFVNTHILADTLTPKALARHLLAGHAYIAFESLATATGFLFYGTDNDLQRVAIMGDSVDVNQMRSLRVKSPLPGRIRLKYNGKTIQEMRGVYELSYPENGRLQPGNYRAEVALELNGKWIPWIYSNPIFVITH